MELMLQQRFMVSGDFLQETRNNVWRPFLLSQLEGRHVMGAKAAAQHPTVHVAAPYNREIMRPTGRQC